MKQKILLIILLLAFLGIADSAYLTYEHYANTIPPCTNNVFIDCGKVLRSEYSIMFGIPLALIGLIHYSILFLSLLLITTTKKKIFKYYTVLSTIAGALFSLYLMYLQLVVIKSICLYCTFSALISFVLFFIAQWVYKKERKELTVYSGGIFYRHAVKPIFFLIDPEFIHERMLTSGKILGSVSLLKKTIEYKIKYDDKLLKQKIAGLPFERPVGLAAGFDYEASLPQILPSLGFGFETIGTITNMLYEGNPKPRLGRLPKSRSLMVNKGFKNAGADEIIRRLVLSGVEGFEMPIGISIGRTNSSKLPTQKKSIEDIISGFIKFEKSKVKHSYYELNISCPNIIHGSNITFYPPKNLKELLTEVEKLRIKKPIFIKMPIEKGNKGTLAMVDVISKFTIKGVVFGNLQKNRKDSALDPEEVKRFKVGNFSGKPTFERSNELIKLAYTHFGKKLKIIGCGGIFNTEDAYTKIRLGASLLQLITGMIYEGPQLIAQINLELVDRLKLDGFKNISKAVGTA